MFGVVGSVSASPAGVMLPALLALTSSSLLELADDDGKFVDIIHHLLTARVCGPQGVYDDMREGYGLSHPVAIGISLLVMMLVGTCMGMVLSLLLPHPASRPKRD